MRDTNNDETVTIQLNSIEDALDDIKQGKIIIVVDDEDRENEGDFFIAAEKITPELMNFMTLHGRGLVCTPLSESLCDRLDLNAMVGNNTDPKGTAFTVSVDLLGHGVTTGISASDRSKTVQSLVDLDTKPTDLSRPGHIFPLRAKKGGVLRRPGHTEAAVDLSKLAGLQEGGVIVEIMNEDGTMARLPQLMVLADRFDMKIISIQDLIAYRLENESLIERVDETKVNTVYGDYNLITYKQLTEDQIHFALVKGEWDKNDDVLVRVKSTNSYFNLFSVLRHGETPLLEKVSNIINEEGRGAIIFINNVANSDMIIEKLNFFKKYNIDENESPLFPIDEKDYGIGAQIIKDLGIQNIKLITQSPQKKRSLNGYGIQIKDYIGL